MSITLYPDLDTWIQSSPNENKDYGASTQLIVGGHAMPGHTVAGLIRFDLSSLDPNQTITSAILRVYQNGGNNSYQSVLGAHRMLVPFYEGDQAGQDATGLVDASTWAYRNAKWNTLWEGGAGNPLGQDCATDPTDSVDITTQLAPYDFDVTADVQAFYRGLYNNYGWMLLPSVGDYPAGKYICAREYATQSLRPQLIIEVEEQSPTLTVEPPVVIALGQTLDFIIFGNNTGWTPGVPGYPVFTVDVGTVVYQRIIGPYLAYLQVTLPTSTDNMVITDPLNDIEGTVDFLGPDTVGSDLSVILNSIQALQSQMKRLLLGGGQDDTDIASQVQKIIDAFALDAVDPDQNWPDSALAKLEAIWPIGTDPDADLGTTMGKIDALGTLVGDIHTDAQTLVGDPAHGIHDVEDKIDALAFATTDDLDDAVEAIKGVDGPTLAAVKTEVDAIRSTDLPAIAALASAAAASAELALAMTLLPLVGETTGSALHLASLAGDVVSMLGDAATIADVIHDWNAAGGDTPVWNLNDLAVKLQAIENELTALSARRLQPSAWPDQANVTLGTPQAFAGPSDIEAEMDGAILNINTVPPGVSRFGGAGGHTWYRMGWYAFYSLEGHIEQPRWLTDTDLILTPTSILRPRGLVLACLSGVEGTVTPWTSEL